MIHFYIYMMINPLTQRIFYVGKGHGRRMNSHESIIRKRQHYNKHLENTVWQIWNAGESVRYRKTQITENELNVFAYERAFINYFGKNNLTNICDGGEGNRGHTCSDDNKEYFRRLYKGRIRSPESIKQGADKIRGRALPQLAGENNPAKRPEVRKKISELRKKHNPGADATRGTKRSKAFCDNIRNKRLGTKLVDGHFIKIDSDESTN